MFFVTHPHDPRPALVVETSARIDDDVIAELKERMLGLGCPNGLLFDPDHCVILHDTYSSLGADSLREDGRVATDAVLARVDASRANALEQRVLKWLQSMASSWNTALPLDGDIASPFISDIVPAVSGSEIREVA